MSVSVRIAATILALLVFAPQATGHGVVRKTGGVITYTASDPGVGAMLEVSSPRRGKVVFSDSSSPGGIDWGPCFPLTERKAECPAGNVTRIEIEVFDGDDVVEARVATPLLIDAGPGDDRVVGGYGRDAIDGGAGNDTLIGGDGADSVVGDAGADSIDIRDGLRDPFSCDSGADTVRADPSDSIPLLFECESVDVAAPPPDTSAPRVKVATGGVKLGSRLEIRASIDEPGTIRLGGKIRSGDQVLGDLGGATARPDAPGQVWTLKPKLSGKTVARVMRALAKGKRVSASLKITARDGVGNSRTERAAVRVRD